MSEEFSSPANVIRNGVPPHLDLTDIPDYWEVFKDPYNRDENACRLLFYKRPHHDPSSAILLLSPNTDRSEHRNGKWTIEVQDTDSDGPSHGYLINQALVENFESVQKASERLVELAHEYPLNKSRTLETTKIDGVRKLLANDKGQIALGSNFIGKTIEVQILGQESDSGFIDELLTPPVEKQTIVTETGLLNLGDEFSDKRILFTYKMK